MPQARVAARLTLTNTRRRNGPLPRLPASTARGERKRGGWAELPEAAPRDVGRNCGAIVALLATLSNRRTQVAERFLHASFMQ